MTLTQAAVRVGPQEYRYALDAAMTSFGGQTPAVLSHLPQLTSEVRWRIPQPAPLDNAGAALWIEPLLGIWTDELAQLVAALPLGAPLVIIASRPLASWLPERRGWEPRALGLQLGGIRRLRRGLKGAGCVVEATYGLHTLKGVGYNWLAGRAERAGKLERGDQLHFVGRMHYCAAGPLAALSTVALILARKERG